MSDESRPQPSAAMIRLGEYIQEQQRLERVRKDEARMRIPEPSSLLPIADRLRMFPLKDPRRVTEARPKFLHTLITVMMSTAMLGGDFGEATKMVGAGLVSLYEGQDGLLYIRLNFGGGYNILGPFRDEDDAWVEGWRTLHGYAGFFGTPVLIPA